jgi:LysM repeat protein
VRDEDTFVLGDVDDDEEDDESFGPSRSGIIAQPEFLQAALPIREGPGDPDGTTGSSTLATEQATNDATPSNYYITRNDTLQGIALRYGLNVSKIQPPHLIVKINA